MARDARPLAVVTRVSAGIGCELAKRRAREGFNLAIADKSKMGGAQP